MWKLPFFCTWLAVHSHRAESGSAALICAPNRQENKSVTTKAFVWHLIKNSCLFSISNCNFFRGWALWMGLQSIRDIQDKQPCMHRVRAKARFMLLGLWEEVEVPGNIPCIHTENMLFPCRNAQTRTLPILRTIVPHHENLYKLNTTKITNPGISKWCKQLSKLN